MAAKGKTTGFYRDDAAELAAGAARTEPTAGRTPLPPLEPSTPQPSSLDPAPAIRIIDPRRPPLKPAPALNQNQPVLRADPDTSIGTAPAQRRRRPSRTVARVIIAPLYIAMALASAGVLLLFIKAWLGF